MMTRRNDSDDGWCALPPAAVAALYVNGIQRFVRENLLAFAGAGTGIAISDALGWREFIAIALLVLLGGLLIALVYRRRFRYRVDDDAVRVRQGLFEQKELKVRLERVQNVGFSQPLYLKPLSLTRVTLETPGAAQTEVELPGISTGEARALRDRINGARGASEAGGAAGSERISQKHDNVVFRADSADLFRYGLTSNQVWILLAFVSGPAANWIGDRVERAVDWATETGMISAEQLAGAPWLAALMVVGLLLGFALLLMMLSGLLAIVRFHGYTLTDDDERFRADFGLLDAREKTLRKSKLHSLQLVQTAIGRLFDNWHVVGHQTGASEIQQQSGAGDKRFLVPGIDSARRCEVAGALRQETWRMPALNAVDKRLRTVFWTRLCAPFLAIAAVLQWAAGAMHWPALALVAFSGMLAGMMHLRWRRWGWLLEGERLTVRSGLVGQSWLVFDLDRCQQVRVTTSPYQRRHGLATVHLRLPHGEQSIPYLAQDTAAWLANRALLSAERALSHAL